MPRLRSGPHHLHRKDVPHLSESLLIGIERWRFVEGSVNEFARLMNRCFVLDRKRLSARERAQFAFLFRAPEAGTRQSLARARCTISPTSGESEGAAATRRRAASARARRPGSSTRQLLSADKSRAATCGFLGSSASTVSTMKS